MMRPILMFTALCLALPALATDAAAQQARQRAQPTVVESQRPTAAEVTLVYEREVFAYRPGGRRDPFRALTDDDEMGPRFEQLSLQGIIYATGQGGSVALFGDGSGRVYRARQGDVLGNVRIIEIGTTRVVLAVDVFGTIRREVLELQRRGGDNR